MKLESRLRDALNPYLSKGSTIPSEVVREWMSRLQYKGEPAFFRLRVRKILARLIGGQPTIRVLKGSIVVLTDEQASAYNPTFFNNSRKRLGRATRRMQAVDTSKLPQERFDDHMKKLAEMTLQNHLVRLKKEPGAELLDENQKRG